MKISKMTIAQGLMFLCGLGLVLYPFVSNWWNQQVSSQVIETYDEALAQQASQSIEEEFKKADDYNQALAKLFFPLEDYMDLDGYNEILNPSGTGMMGYIEIEKIDVKLPIYHGTSHQILNTAVGHLEGSSFPTAKPSTHSVLSAHRGLPNAVLFSQLDKLSEGDRFQVTILNHKQEYEVDQIKIVDPYDVENLYIEPGKAYCTLLTCTPYGVNSQRLLVRGHPVDAAPKGTVNEAVEMSSLLIAPVLFVLLLGLLLWAENWVEKKVGSKSGKEYWDENNYDSL
ncbi:MAG: class C sortase [Ileibacterium sp.]|nr:class C sortase [Ileibacterium sp.]